MGATHGTGKIDSEFESDQRITEIWEQRLGQDDVTDYKSNDLSPERETDGKILTYKGRCGIVGK